MATEPTSATGSTALLKALARDMRRAAVASATAARIAVIRELGRELGDDERHGKPFLMSYTDEHLGAPPEPIDEVAKEAALAPILDALGRMGIHASQIVPAGEEAGGSTRALVPNLYIVRQDSLDGTTPALLRWDGFSAVSLIDRVQDARDGAHLRARHLAGAIACSTGWVVSWAQWSHYVAGIGYRNIMGAVYLSHAETGQPEIELSSLRWDRRVGTLAAVAHSPARREHTMRIADNLGISYEKAFYTSAGTPIAPALLLGQICAVIEPEDVTLHDSAMLIPFQILGGGITDPAGQPMNYLRTYEANALDLRPQATPIGGYVAWVK